MSNIKHKITDQIRNLSTEKASFSFEFFPPKTQQGFENLKSRIQRMTELGPAFVTVTWGVGGSTADKSLKLAKYAQQLGNVVCLHLTCTNMDKSILDTALEKAKRLGISNILALRGDPPRNEEYGDNLASDFVHAVDLVKYIRKSHGDFFCIGVAGYPEGHTDGSDMSEQDPIKDIPYLEEKVKAGADFIITQLFYDVDKFVDYENMLRNHESGIFKDIDIIPGLMPINTFQSFVRSSKLSHASVPPALMDKLTEIKGNDESVKQFGVDALSEIISQVYTKTNGRTRVFHFYTLNLERSVALILEVCSAFQISDMLKTEPKSLENDNMPLNGDIPTFSRQISASAHNKAITNQPEINNLSVPESIVNAGISKPSRSLDFFAISAGEGTLGRQANWDDFPNGRFGDSRSPAFGEIDGYGPNLHADNKKAYKLWGHPVSKKDISTLFISHITGKLSAIPWSDQSLDPETALIQEQLIELNNRQMWTLSSQPACDSVKSSDKIFGWGPQSGWVFQKAYVEFFVSSEMFDKLIKEKIGAQNTYQTVTYYACDSRGNFVTNEEKGSSNIVTWGVFPNREILQSTLIERESFSAWADEAFCLWKEWQKLYAKNTPSHNLIEEVLNDYYLVTIIHHDFKKEFGLWDLLLDTKL